jgi:hypothetical protein
MHARQNRSQSLHFSIAMTVNYRTVADQMHHQQPVVILDLFSMDHGQLVMALLGLLPQVITFSKVMIL